MTVARPEAVRDAEQWFLRHGLPYFVDAERRRVHDGLSRGRLLPVLGTAVLTGAAVGVAGGLALHTVSAGLVLGLLTAGVVLALYAATTLRLRIIARWAAGRTLASLGLMFPLVTRALPLLMLFSTFLFINTEVWMVADSLDPGVLGLAVMFFAAMAIGFLLVRLPEELDRVDDDVDPERLAARTSGTPLQTGAAELFADADPAELRRTVEVVGLEKGNLILVLLVAQTLQVLLLAVSVLLFFLVFGSVVMQDSVVESWIGHRVQGVPGLGGLTPPLVKVSVFLAGFSGLYFTVYAVTDETYRQQFFTSVTRELERAIAVRAVYRHLLR